MQCLVNCFAFLSVFMASVQGQPLRVLFIGNSYTYYNDLPVLVANLAEASGQNLSQDSITHGGWSWEDHWNSQETLDKINSQVWDVVIMQEFSTRLAQQNDSLCKNSVPNLDNLVKEIRTNSPDALIQFYLTWGRPYGLADQCDSNPNVCTYESMQDALTANYLNVACMNKPSKVAPVGEAFRQIKTEFGDPDFFDLFVDQGLTDHHPTLQGSYLSACVHFATLFGVPASGNTFVPEGLDPEMASRMQTVADDVIGTGTQWNFPTDDSCTNCICICNQQHT